MTEANNRYYFAYGSNMDSAQMSDRCPGAAFVGIAELPGYRFIINGRGVATIVPESSESVHGVLWTITKSDEKALDGLEGVKWGTYAKVTTSVETRKGESVSGLVYVAKDNTEGAPKAGYIEQVIAAAGFHKLPAWYIGELRTWLQTDST